MTAATGHLFILGGARSGKSGYAEAQTLALARARGLTPVYLATAEAWDGEMTDRIARHRADRGDGWTTVEEPLGLPRALLREARVDRVVLVDCLTLWVTNLMMKERSVEEAGAALVATLGALKGPVALVSNEVGQGIVPGDPLSRAFRDHAGRLHQNIAAAVPNVAFVVAGLPMMLKGGPWVTNP